MNYPILKSDISNGYVRTHGTTQGPQTVGELLVNKQDAQTDQNRNQPQAFSRPMSYAAMYHQTPYQAKAGYRMAFHEIAPQPPTTESSAFLKGKCTPLGGPPATVVLTNRPPGAEAMMRGMEMSNRQNQGRFADEDGMTYYWPPKV